MLSDETAYRQYLAGDEQGAVFLVEKYGDPLTIYIHGYIKDIHEAEDLMIEAFSCLFTRERPIRDAGTFKSYLYTIARRLAIRHTQKHRLRFLRIEDLRFEPQSDILADTQLHILERNLQLYHALQKIRTECREALYLVYFENMSYREAATVMEKSESQITNLVHRGKKALKTTLEKEGFTYADH